MSGAEYDVPLQVIYALYACLTSLLKSSVIRGVVLLIFTPGAAISTELPKFEKTAGILFSSVAETDITSGWQAGKKI